MLILSRKKGQTIKLPELEVEIEITQIKGGCVKVGVKAPREVRVVRGELEVKELKELLTEMEAFA
jgi:carbon storage regulator